MKLSAAKPSSPPFLQNRLWIFFFSILVFLCCADRFFVTRIDGYNFRLGQLVLLLTATGIAYQMIRNRFSDIYFSHFYQIIKNWIPFFIAYAIAAAVSPESSHTWIKLIWAVFNITGAALLFLGFRQWDFLKKGLFYGITAVAVFIWIEFIFLYLFGQSAWFNFLSTTPSESIPWYRELLGFAQDAYDFQGSLIFRPNAFYYEPSYAGCALTLAFPLCLAVLFKKNLLSWKNAFIPALLFGAVFITTSRSGILGICLGIFSAVIFCFYRKRPDLLKTFFKIILLTLLIFIFFGFFSGARTYMRFFINILGPNAVLSRINDTQSSEGWRIANIQEAIRFFKAHPFTGIGVPPLSASRGLNGLGQTCQSMWLEILIESGALGFFTFLFGLVKSLRDSIGKKNYSDQTILIFAALIPHLLVSMNFTSTFPRLDYWMLFFFAIRLAFESRKEKQ